MSFGSLCAWSSPSSSSALSAWWSFFQASWVTIGLAIIIIINILFFCITSIIIIMIILSGLLSHYGPGHHDYTDTNMALSKVQKELLSSFLEQTNHHLFTKISPGKMKVRTIIKKLSTKLKESENLVKLMELQRDLVIIIIFHPFRGSLRIKVCGGFGLVIIAMH